MYVVGNCIKCRTKIVINIEGMTEDEAKAALAKTDMGECPGYHVEVGKMSDYYKIDWSKKFKTAEEANKYDTTS